MLTSQKVAHTSTIVPTELHQLKAVSANSIYIATYVDITNAIH